ncbi:MAG: sigma-70 family RNA polymerase sigma factor [Lachnospiraceae bacterium]|nr:sigma-70 family RNA polymerase sigma factor [Lachnospiraceae bacterium]
MDKELERLVHKAKGKDPDAFTALMNACVQHMYKTAKAILMNDEDVADAMQETIMTCWEKMGTLKEDRYFKAWVTKILINECYDLIRGRKGVTYVEEIPEIADDREKSDLEWKEALAVLGEEYRLPVVLYYVQGFQTKEIAKLMGISDAAVRTRLSRAREQLRKYYEEA